MMTTLRYGGFQPLVADDPRHLTMSMPAPSGAPPPVPTPAVPAAPAANPAPGQPPAASSNKVSIGDNRYRPAIQTVPVGTTVTWTNEGTNVHTVTSLDGLFDSPSLIGGATFSFTFTRSGVYRYFCRQHFRNGMLANVTVS
jgi:plastocyanin